MTTPQTDPGGVVDTASLGAAQTIALAAGAAAGNQFTGRCALLGYSVQTGAAAGGLAISDGSANPGLAIAGEVMAASLSQTRWFGPQGIELTRGLYVALAGANTTATIYYQVLPQE